jgi:hypothetical protein
VKAECYLKHLQHLQEHFVPNLQDMTVNVEETFYEQNGTIPHTMNSVLHFLNECFHDWVISNQYPE